VIIRNEASAPVPGSIEISHLLPLQAEDFEPHALAQGTGTLVVFATYYVDVLVASVILTFKTKSGVLVRWQNFKLLGDVGEMNLKYLLVEGDDDQALVRDKGGVVVAGALQRVTVDEVLIALGLWLLDPFYVYIIHIFYLHVTYFALFELVQTFSVLVMAMCEFELLLLHDGQNYFSLSFAQYHQAH
jgi:hypothetical protein